MLKRQAAIAVVLLLSGGMAACDKAVEGPRNGPQTNFAGQLSAGGGTSGDVMAKNGTLQAKSDPMGSPVLVPVKAEESQPPARSGTPPKGAAEDTTAAGTGKEKPEGTPGIPEGAGGNVSGTAMGGTSLGAAGSKENDTQAKSAPASDAPPDKEAQAKAKAEQEKQQLQAAMDRVAQRWQATASARGWQTGMTDEAVSTGTSTTQQTQTSAIGLPAVIRSEKLGTAPPSEDVKQPARDPSN